MTWTYDNSLRRDVATALKGTNVLQAADYDFDLAGRLWKVKDGNQQAVYTYDANSALIGTVSLTNGAGASQGLAVSRAYDKLNRLQSASSKAYGGAATNLPISFAYQYNTANQRTRTTLADGSYWIYQYDTLGQVISGRRYWRDGSEVLGQQFDYRFDDIGNRKLTGGRASASSSYTNNLLNQITGRGVAGVVDVLGLANPTTNVTVNGNVASRKGEYFHHALSVANTNAQYPTITVTSQYGGQQSQSGEVFVPAVSELFTYDLDGNLTADGRWTYSWDGENRLVEMKRDTNAPTPSCRLRLVFDYDQQGRRIRKTFYTHDGTNWVEQRDTICLYDGWNVMAELDTNDSNAKLRTYVWGTDLSGTLGGAGGVGGLLWVNNLQSTYGGQSLPVGVHFVAYDGNGNVVALVQAADGAYGARYEYGPFGEPIRQTGALADAQPFRFSTKWTDVESGLLYYGYRYYNPVMGRWLSRDPINDFSFRQIAHHHGLSRTLCHVGRSTFEHSFVCNDPVSKWDMLGLAVTIGPPWACPQESGWMWNGESWNLTTPNHLICMYKRCGPKGPTSQLWTSTSRTSLDQVGQYFEGGCIGIFRVKVAESCERFWSCTECRHLWVEYEITGWRLNNGRRPNQVPIRGKELKRDDRPSAQGAGGPGSASCGTRVRYEFSEELLDKDEADCPTWGISPDEP